MTACPCGQEIPPPPIVGDGMEVALTIHYFKRAVSPTYVNPG